MNMKEDFTASYIVHCPAGCGKTANAEEIAAALGLKCIVDGWDGDRKTFTPFDTLFITNAPPAWAAGHPRLISYEEVMKTKL
jgi:hypothetical protein